MIVLLCFLMILINREQIREYFATRDQLSDKRSNVEHLQNQLGQLERQRNALEKGGHETERAARKHLDLIYEGEKVIQIERPDAPLEDSPVLPESPTSPE